MSRARATAVINYSQSVANLALAEEILIDWEAPRRELARVQGARERGAWSN